MAQPFLLDSIRMIQETIDRFDDQVCVACSFGKDSMVVLDLVKSIKPDVMVVHYKAAPFPETVKFKNEVRELWNLDLIELGPYKNMGYWKCVEKYGLPGIRTSQRGKRHSPKCCHYLKEKPMQDFINRNEIEVVFTGLTASESWNRRKTAYRYDTGTWRGGLKDTTIEVLEEKQTDTGWRFCGMRYWAKTWNSWQVHPIMAWNEADVWRYTKDNDLPVNPVYEKWGGVHKRVGCLPCTAYISWEKNLRRSHPKLYRHLKKIELAKETTLENYFL